MQMSDCAVLKSSNEILTKLIYTQLAQGARLAVTRSKVTNAWKQLCYHPANRGVRSESSSKVVHSGHLKFGKRTVVVVVTTVTFKDKPTRVRGKDWPRSVAVVVVK